MFDPVVNRNLQEIALSEIAVGSDRMTSKRFLQSEFIAEQQEFAELARGLTEDEWDSPSLCQEWNVRQVVIHTAWHIQLAKYPVKEAIPYLRLGGDRFYARLFARHADRTNGDLAGSLAAPARCNPPNLCELAIHQQDVRRAVGKPRAIPHQQVRWLLDYGLSKSGNGQTGGKPRKRSEGLRLVASDFDWSAGDGPEVRGTGESILMAITGRSTALAELSGPGVQTLATR